MARLRLASLAVFALAGCFTPSEDDFGDTATTSTASATGVTSTGGVTTGVTSNANGNATGGVTSNGNGNATGGVTSNGNGNGNATGGVTSSGNVTATGGVTTGVASNVSSTSGTSGQGTTTGEATTATTGGCGCQSDADCAQFGAGAVCRNGGCFITEPNTGGTIGSTGCGFGDAATSTGSTTGSETIGGTSGTSGTTGTGPWSCIGHELPVDASGPTTTLTLTFADLISQAHRAGLLVSACRVGNPSCVPGTGSGGPDAVGTTDSNGVVVLTLPLQGGAYDGYISLIDPVTQILPTLIYPQPFVEDPDLYEPTVSMQDLMLLQTLVGPTGFDLGSHGLVLADLFDCAGDPPTGMQLSVAPTDSSTQTMYLAGGIPSTTATSTDGSGQALVINVVPSNAVQVAATYDPAGDRSYVGDVVVQTGGLTIVVGAPNQ